MAICFKEVDVIPASLYGRTGAMRDIDAGAALLASTPEIASALVTQPPTANPAPSKSSSMFSWGTDLFVKRLAA
jgi:hypothetical protein